MADYPPLRNKAHGKPIFLKFKIKKKGKYEFKKKYFFSFRKSGKIIGIEVKNSGHIDHNDAKGLKYLKDYVKDKWHYGIVLYTGDKSIPLGEKIVALPISSLWGF